MAADKVKTQKLKSDMKITDKGFHQLVENETKRSVSLAA